MRRVVVNDILAWGVVGISIYILMTIMEINNAWVNGIGIIGSVATILAETLYLFQAYVK